MSEYTVLEYNRLSELIRVVNIYLGLGWKLVGGVCANEMGGGVSYYAQAMTKGKK